jgi:hypothetical protein
MNKDTIAAMLKADHIAHDPSLKGYNNIDELIEDLEENEDGLYFYMDDSVVVPGIPKGMEDKADEILYAFMKKKYGDKLSDDFFENQAEYDEEIDAYLRENYAYLFVED